MNLRKNEEELSAKKAVPEFSMLFANIGLQLVGRGGRMEVNNIIPLFLEAKSDAGELCRHVDGASDCTRILDNRKNEELTREIFTEKRV